jgi:hypothetical protein
MAAAMRETEARLTAAEAAAAAAAERAQLAEEGRAVAERATDEARRQSTRAVEAARGASEMQVQTLQRDAEQREAALRQWAAGLQAECTEQGRAALRNDRDAADAHAAAMREQQTAHAAVTTPCSSLLMVFRMAPFICRAAPCAFMRHGGDSCHAGTQTSSLPHDLMPCCMCS